CERRQAAGNAARRRHDEFHHPLPQRRQRAGIRADARLPAGCRPAGHHLGARAGGQRPARPVGRPVDRLAGARRPRARPARAGRGEPARGDGRVPPLSPPVVAADTTYVIRGGAQGRERLRLLSSVMGPGTAALLDAVGIAPGSHCLDVGCGGGDVAMALARRVGPAGRVTGVDFDEAKLAIARGEAEAAGLRNVAFEAADVTAWAPSARVDVAYARFLLAHLAGPAALLATLARHLRPGGTVIVEDVDF